MTTEDGHSSKDTRNVPELVACKRKRPHAPSPRVAMAISIFVAKAGVGGGCKQRRWKSGECWRRMTYRAAIESVERTKREERPSSGSSELCRGGKTPNRIGCNASIRRLESPWPICPNLHNSPSVEKSARTHARTTYLELGQHPRLLGSFIDQPRLTRTVKMFHLGQPPLLEPPNLLILAFPHFRRVVPLFPRTVSGRTPSRPIPSADIDLGARTDERTVLLWPLVDLPRNGFR
jgi:hypothetical protein